MALQVAIDRLERALEDVRVIWQNGQECADIEQELCDAARAVVNELRTGLAEPARETLAAFRNAQEGDSNDAEYEAALGMAEVLEELIVSDVTDTSTGKTTQVDLADEEGERGVGQLARSLRERTVQ